MWWWIWDDYGDEYVYDYDTYDIIIMTCLKFLSKSYDMMIWWECYAMSRCMSLNNNKWKDKLMMCRTPSNLWGLWCRPWADLRAIQGEAISLSRSKGKIGLAYVMFMMNRWSSGPCTPPSSIRFGAQIWYVHLYDEDPLGKE